MKNSDDANIEVNVLKEISSKLDLVIALLAIQGRDENQQLEILQRRGFNSAVIGSLTGKSADAVRQWRMKRKAK